MLYLTVIGAVQQVVSKKGGIMVVTNDSNKFIPTQMVTYWRAFIDFHKLKKGILRPFGWILEV